MFIIKSNLRTIIIILLFIVSLYGAIVVGKELNTIHLAVLVVKDDKAVSDANVYVFAVTPNGTRLMAVASTDNQGMATFEFSIGEVIKPIINWNSVQKAIQISPGFYITVIGRVGEYKYFGTGSVKLPLKTIGPLITSTMVELKDRLLKVEGALASTVNYKQQAPPWATLVYSKEESLRETLFKVATDPHTTATVDYTMNKYEEIAFKCTFSVTLKYSGTIIIPWKVDKEISWVTSQSEKTLLFNVPQSSVNYISCLVTFTYECWEYEEPADGGELYREHRVYIRYHLPDSLDTTKGVDDIGGTEQFLKSSPGQGLYPANPTTDVKLREDVSTQFALPGFGFVRTIPLDYLPVSLVVSIDVCLVLKSGYAVDATVIVYCESGYTVSVYYIKVYRTVNADYSLPCWAIILKT
ncbi:MAG: hypothetical protein NDF58_06530 [archaeon YNP-LCB-024-027]|jgi:hypothetical protein|nr:hypothetical protein [Candidatus Culexarchaeum yellowstonense]